MKQQHNINSQLHTSKQVINGVVEEIDYTEFRDLRNAGLCDEFYVGSLHVPTGRLVITDPLALYNLAPLEKEVEAGDYPVFLYFRPTDFGYRTCYAMIQFGHTLPETWEYALMDASLLQEKYRKINGIFLVDAGLLSFSDAQVNREYHQRYRDFERARNGGNFYDEVLAQEFAKNADHPPGSAAEGDWLDYHVNGDSGNIIMFSSGLGDGAYPAYWGLDGNGTPVQLVVDFLTLKRVRQFREASR